jgi:hypothetical protein
MMRCRTSNEHLLKRIQAITDFVKIDRHPDRVERHAGTWRWLEAGCVFGGPGIAPG